MIKKIKKIFTKKKETELPLLHSVQLTGRGRFKVNGIKINAESHREACNKFLELIKEDDI